MSPLQWQASAEGTSFSTRVARGRIGERRDVVRYSPRSWWARATSIGAELWLALTERRLLVFAGSWFTFTHKPKKLLTEVLKGEFSLTWREDKDFTDFRLLHFVFPDDQHIVRMGEVDEESDRFLASLGPDSGPMPT